MTNLPRISRLRVAAAALTAIAIGTAPALFTGEWGNTLLALAGITVGLICVWIGYRIGHANARAERAYQVELARGDDADPDPFATQLRIDPDTDTTGETR